MLEFRRLHLIFVLLFSSMCFFHQAPAQTSSYGELQAAYLYNFSKYITWPNEPFSFTIGIMGETEIIDDLQKILKGKKVRGKEIELKTIKTIEEGKQYQIIYLSSNASDILSSLNRSIVDKNILVVTEDDLVKNGAIISFFVDDEKLKFKINKKMLMKSGLQAADGLLKLGMIY